MKPKQIAALIGAILLVLLYASTLVAAILDNPNTNHFFTAAVGGTIGIPVILWLLIMFLKRSEDTKNNNKLEDNEKEKPGD